MALKITEECIYCGACEPECPNGSISQSDELYVIDAAKCTECKGQHERARVRGRLPGGLLRRRVATETPRHEKSGRPARVYGRGVRRCMLRPVSADERPAR